MPSFIQPMMSKPLRELKADANHGKSSTRLHPFLIY